MDKALRNALRNTVTQCRRLLEEAVAGLLEGQFGVHRTGLIEEEARLTHLSPDDLTYRAQVVACLDHLRAGGARPEEAVAQLVRETAFTHLNRLCAFKLAERRKFIRETVSRGLNSNGFKLYLADHPEEEQLWSSGRQAMAYRHFLEAVGESLAREVPFLFSPLDPANRLFPPQPVLDQVLRLLNAAELDEVWSEDETIGWVYQYFTPKELRDQARKESQAPRNSYELAFRNQFYTPRYVVEFLADNTLGRLWYEMRRGETALADSCCYLVRRPGETFDRPKKDPRELRILDPACGSGHFLLYCFDLLLVIYQEAYDDPELGPKLKETYPTLADLRRALPGLILRHNLYGIDIDLWATQIAALALWLRAQRAYQELGVKADERPAITRANVIHAEPMPGEREMLAEFVAGLHPPVLGQLVRAVFDRMELAGEAGSLLKVEEEIEGAVAEAKRQWLNRPRHEQLTLLAVEPRASEQFGLDLSGITDEQFWDEAEHRLVEALETYARQAANGKGFARQLFAEDAEAGFAFVDASRQRFDVVLMNPPFGESAKGAKAYLEKTFPRSKHDLACAFVERWLERLAPGGRLGAITTRTPFFLSSSTKWREEVILSDGTLEVFADLGYGVLEAMVETAAYCLTRGGTPHPALFLRLFKDDDKGAALAEAVGNPEDSRRFSVEPASFRQVPNSPLCYWVSERIRRLFKELPPFEGEGRTVKQGLATADDFRFVRLWTEVPPEKIYKKWFPFAKGGAYSPYYADLHLVVNWENDGAEIKAWICDRYPYLDGKWEWVAKNTDFYFRPGLTYTNSTTSKFSIRCLPANAVFSHMGQSCFFEGPQDAMVYLAVMNSSMFQFLLDIQVALADAGRRHYEVGIIRQTPIPVLAVEQKKELVPIVQERLQAEHRLSGFDEAGHSFNVPALLASTGSTLRERLVGWQGDIRQCTEARDTCQEKIEGIIAMAYGDATDSCRSALEHFFQCLPHPETGSVNVDAETDEVGATEPRDLRGFVIDVLSYGVGCAFGRWDVRLATGEKQIHDSVDPFAPLPVCSPGMLVGEDGLPVREAPPGYPLRIDPDGILADDPDSPEDIVRRVREVFEVIWKERAEAIEREACELLGLKELRDYFRNPQGFFADHIKRYSKSHRKAPIYWLLQSPRKSYGLWLYYHRLDKDILFKALTLYVEPKLRLEENRLEEMRGKVRAAAAAGQGVRALERELEKQETLLSDLQDFRDRLERAAKLYLVPDLDDGVVLNIAPLWELVPWKEAKAYWEKLLDGEYPWSSIGQQLRAKGLVK